MHVQGHYFPKASSNYQQGVANISDTCVEISYDDQLISSHAISDITLTSGLAGLADELNFNDGSRFIPTDVNYRWPFKANKHDLLERLEKNKWAITVIKFNNILFLLIFLLSCSQSDNYIGKNIDIYPVEKLKLSENKIYIIED